MASNYDETYLDGLIAKAKKSWEGVDVDSYMSDLRDDTFDKEVAENLSKEVASYITEQMKSNMDKATIKCRDLMVGDWITNRNGFPMQITNVGEGYAYATWEGNEGDMWEFDDKEDKPYPIPLTLEILEKNGFVQDDEYTDAIADGCFCRFLIWHYYANEVIISYDGSEELVISNNLGYPCSEITLYRPKIHELQQALRLCGLNEIADNFKV